MTLAGARLFHVNVNCTSLDRSLAFWEGALGFERSTRTTPAEAQDGAAFGLPRARWDAWILTGSSGFGGGAVDLLEWQEPEPAAQPASTLLDAGFSRLGCYVPDLDEVARQVAAAGTLLSSPRTDDVPEFGAVRSCFATDPDGCVVELVEGDGPQMAFVAVTCADRDASASFYIGLGFTEVARFTVAAEDGSHLGIAGAVAMDALLLAPPGGGAVMLELVRMRAPVTAPAPVAARPANAPGIWRAAFLVDDIDAAVGTLTARGVATISPVASMAMGPGLPELRFVCFRGPDTEVIELIEAPAASPPDR